jgi:hypothetical protein
MDIVILKYVYWEHVRCLSFSIMYFRLGLEDSNCIITQSYMRKIISMSYIYESYE